MSEISLEKCCGLFVNLSGIFVAPSRMQTHNLNWAIDVTFQELRNKPPSQTKKNKLELLARYIAIVCLFSQLALSVEKFSSETFRDLLSAGELFKL